MYKLLYRANLEKTLRYIPKKDQEKIKRFLYDLSTTKDPFLHAKKIQGASDLYRYRVGNYRVLATIDNKIITITIIDIDHRKDVYKSI